LASYAWGGVVVMLNPHLNAEQIRYFYDYTTPAAALVDQGVIDAFAEAGRGANRVPALIEVGGSDFDLVLSRSSTDFEVYATD